MGILVSIPSVCISRPGPCSGKKALGPEIISKVCATPNMVSPFMEMGEPIGTTMLEGMAN